MSEAHGAVGATQSDAARWLQRGIKNVRILRHIGVLQHDPEDEPVATT